MNGIFLNGSIAITKVPDIARAIIWFIGTTRSAVVVILMSIVSFLIVTKEEVEEYIIHGCHPGTQNCTMVTLSKIHDISLVSFGVPTEGGT